MTTHSGILAWRIPWAEEPGWLQSMGLQRVRHNLSDLACMWPFIRFPGGSEVKASAWNVGDLGSIPGSGRSPGEGNGTPLQYSCLENPMEGGGW